MPVPDSQFERTFADLAYAHLRDKAPTLFDYLVGFQVLDANDDQTKAIGVFGAKVGSDWVYLPVFFLNGELKGHELMYLKGQDMFVPLQENWINYVLQKRPYTLGETSDTTRHQIAMSAPDLSVFSTSPRTYGKFAQTMENIKTTRADFIVSQVNGIKTASASLPAWHSGNVQPWAAPYVDHVKRSPNDNRYVKSAERLNIPTFVSTAGPDAARTLVYSMLKCAGFGDNVLRFYRPEELLVRQFTKKAEQDIFRKAKAPEVPKVIVLTTGDIATSPAKNGLTEKEKKDLLRGQIVIKDHRTNKTEVYKADIARSLTNPTDTGVYELLTRIGKLRKVLVITAPVTIGTGRSSGCATVVDIDGKKASNFPVSDLNVRQKVVEDWGEFFGSLSSVSSIKDGSEYVIVSADGKGTIPFKVEEKKENADGSIELWVRDDTYVKGGYRRHSGKEEARITYSCNTDRYNKILITDTKSGMHNVGATLFVGEQCKAYKVKDAEINNSGSCCTSSPFGEGKHKEPKPSEIEVLDPGTLADAELFLRENESVLPLKVYSNQTDYHISVGSMSTGTLTKVSAVKHLVYQQGLGGDEAIRIIKEAEENGTARALIKHASPYPMLDDNLVKKADELKDDSPIAPYMPDPEQRNQSWLGVPMQEPQERNLPVQSLMADRQSNRHLYNPDPRLDDTATGMANNASKTRQKDIFDASVVGHLVKTTRSDDLIEKYVPDLLLALDRIGRILFLLYSHGDDFRERYGSEDLNDFEAHLKDTFEALGNLVLFLKQKTVEPNPTDQRTQVDIGGDSNDTE